MSPGFAPSQARTFVSEGRTRRFYLGRPEGEPPPRGWPLILGFHQAYSTPRAFATLSGFPPEALRAGYAVALLEGSAPPRERGYTFNGGHGRGFAAEAGIDDVQAVRDLLEVLAQGMPLDRDRVHATGISNGAMLTQLLAEELSGSIASVASVAGLLPRRPRAGTRAVPLLHIHGDQDDFVRFQGGVGSRSPWQSSYPPVPLGIAGWARLYGCTPGWSRPIRAPGSSSSVATQHDFSPGFARSRVRWIQVHGGGHTWPGGRGLLDRQMGPTIPGFSASRAILKWFAKNPRTKVDPWVAKHLAFRGSDYRASFGTAVAEWGVGERSAPIEAWLQAQGLSAGAYLTAFNPQGEALPESENRRRNLRLQARLEQLGWAFLPAESQDRRQIWPIEPGFLVGVSSWPRLRALLREFGQLAACSVSKEAPADLVWS